MELINKLERIVLGWVKNVPHLPATGQKWLGVNVWWIALIAAIIGGIWFLFALNGLFSLLTLLSSVSNLYYVTNTYTDYAIFKAIIGLVFLGLTVAALALAISPLKDRLKKGWVLLFLAWIISALSIVVSAVLSLSVIGFIISIIFGAIFLAIGGYFLFEIHGQFAHPTKRAKKV